MSHSPAGRSDSSCVSHTASVIDALSRPAGCKERHTMTGHGGGKKEKRKATSAAAHLTSEKSVTCRTSVPPGVTEQVKRVNK